MSIITELQGSWFPKEKIPACPLYICRWFWSLSLLILILCSTSNLTKAFAKYGVEHRIRNLSQDILRMCRDRASKLRFFKFFASNENERCLVHRPSIVQNCKLIIHHKPERNQLKLTVCIRGLSWGEARNLRYQVLLHPKRDHFFERSGSTALWHGAPLQA